MVKEDSRISNLHERLQMYMPADSDNASLIIDHIPLERHRRRVRNDPASAGGLLAWSEGATVVATLGCPSLPVIVASVPRFFLRGMKCREAYLEEWWFFLGATSLGDCQPASVAASFSFLPPPQVCYSVAQLSRAV